MWYIYLLSDTSVSWPFSSTPYVHYINDSKICGDAYSKLPYFL